jgi:hypothetical protein
MILAQGPLQASFVLALALALTGTGSQAPVPDLKGTWKLDAAKSGDAESEVLKGAGKDDTHGMDHLERVRILDRLTSLVRALDVIEIEQTEKEVQVSDNKGNFRIYYLDGKKHPRQTPWGAPLDAVAAWKDGSLVVKSRGEEVGEIEETYGLEGRQLVLIVRARNPRFENEIVVRQYYDRASE